MKKVGKIVSVASLSLCVFSFLPILAHALDSSIGYSVFNVDLDETASMRDFENVTKFLVVYPDIATAQLVTNQEISITGKKVGRTFLHVWDGEKVVTISIVVKYGGVKVSEKTIKEMLAVGESQPLKISHYVTTSKRRSKAQEANYEWRAIDEKHGLAVSADTPFGYFNCEYEYLFRKDREGLAEDTDYVNFNLTNDYYKATYGDIDGYLSDITMPTTHYQGFKISSGEKSEKFKYDVLIGKTGYYLWGQRLNAFGQLENIFYGLRTEINPQDDLSLYSTFLYSDPATAKLADVASYVGSVGTKYSVGEYLTLGTEVATNKKERTALTSSLALTYDKFSFNAAYKDVTVDFLNTFGSAPFTGKRGVYTRANFRPVNILSLSGGFNLYQNRANPDPDSVDKGNKDFIFETRLLCPPTNTSFLVSLYNRDNKGQASPSLGMGQNYEVIQKFKDVPFLKYVEGYVRYTPARYKNYITGDSNFIDKTLNVGTTIKPLKGLTLSCSETLNFRKWQARGLSTAPSRFNAGISYGSRIGELPLDAKLYFGFQKDSHVNTDRISSILGEDKATGRVELNYQLNSFLDCFLRGEMSIIKGPANSELNRVQTDIFAGMKYLWDTGITWRGHGTVRGTVFEDSNRNGEKDKGEPPFKGAEILVDRGKGRTSNSYGFYRIRNVEEGIRKVSLDPDSLPEHYTVTTPLNVEVAVKNMEVVEVRFGVAPKTVIKGFAFNDLDRDGKYNDSVDEVISNALIELDDGTTAFTSIYGNFTMHNVVPGSHTITVNKDSLPKNVVPYGSLVRNITSKEGETKELEFAFYALRAVAGRVYIDSNGNNRFDEDEGVGGVTISYEGKVTTSEEDGYYMLRDLPSGKVELEVYEESLPEGYVTEDEFIEIELKKEKDIKEDVNIKVIPQLSLQE